MKVKVRPINVNGRPEFKKQRERREVYAGELKVHEDRLPDLGRSTTTARVVSMVDSVESTLLQIHDAVLLWVDKDLMRIRGFEDVDGVQFSQTWEVELL